MIFCVISLPQSWAECPSSESTVPTQLRVELIQRSGVSISVQKHIFQSFEVSALYQAQRLNLGTRTPCLNIQCSSFFFIFATYISRANLFILQKGTEVGGSLKSEQPKENKNVLIKNFFLATVGPIALFLKNLCDWLPLDFAFYTVITVGMKRFPSQGWLCKMSYIQVKSVVAMAFIWERSRLLKRITQ